MGKAHYIEKSVLCYYLSPDSHANHFSSLNENVVHIFFFYIKLVDIGVSLVAA